MPEFLMSFSKRLCLTARSSIKCQYVRFENRPSDLDGVSVDIVGNDLRLLYDQERDFVLKQTADLSNGGQDDFIWIA